MKAQAKSSPNAAAAPAGAPQAAAAPTNPVSPATESHIASLRGGGQPLTPVQRTYFEPHFGDLAAVRLHTGLGAQDAAREVSARAFTVGRDIAFGRGEYQPGSTEGRRLLAHELTHTVQQGAGVLRRETADRAAASDLQGRVRALADEQLIAALDELSLTGGSGGGRAGAESAGEPIEDYAHLLRQQVRARPTSADLFGLGASPPVLAGPEALGQVDPLAPLGVQPGLFESRENLGARVLPVLEAEARSRLHPATLRTELFVRGTERSWSRTTSTADLQAAVEQVQTRLQAVTVPTASGHLRQMRRGPAYTAARDGATAHRDYVFGGREVLGLTSARDRRRWEIFEFVMATEGDTSAINAWDDQIVTFGAGYSMNSGLAQQVFQRMPEAFRRHLFEHGIEIETDGTMAVLDLDLATVTRGDDGAELLRHDERRLSLLINLAQSEESMTEGEVTAPAREWMLRAQFELLESRVEEDVLDDWALGVAKLAVKMNHWQPSVATWRNLRAWSSDGTDANAMASEARDAIWEFQSNLAARRGRALAPEYQLDAIETRFRNRARRAGVGALRFGARPVRRAPAPGGEGGGGP